MLHNGLDLGRGERHLKLSVSVHEASENLGLEIREVS